MKPMTLQVLGVLALLAAALVLDSMFFASSAGLVTLAMFPIQAFTLEQLAAQSTPAAVPGGNMEAYPKVLYDTQTYPLAGSIASLTFFQAVGNDRSLSNMEAPGQLPDPKYFRVFWLQCHVILPKSSAAAPTAVGDMQSIIDIRRPFCRLIIQDKPYGDIPLINMPSPGGVNGHGYTDGTGAGVVSHEWAGNGAPVGGFWIGGSLLIKPKINFAAEIRWGGATRAVAADTLIRIQMLGVEYRAIV